MIVHLPANSFGASGSAGFQPVTDSASRETPAATTFSYFMGGPKAHEELF
jgi:hypothetical protein